MDACVEDIDFLCYSEVRTFRMWYFVFFNKFFNGNFFLNGPFEKGD